jgi:hypothetical protein
VNISFVSESVILNYGLRSKRQVNYGSIRIIPGSVADPESGAILTPRLGILNRYLLYKHPGSATLVKKLKFFDADPGSDQGWKNSDPGSGMGKSWILDKHPGSATQVGSTNRDKHPGPVFFDDSLN